MATIEWVNKASSPFVTASAWIGGKTPGTADIAVVSSAGDSKPTKHYSTGILSPAAGSSSTYLSSTSLSSSTSETSSKNGQVTKYTITPQKSSVPVGETISPAMLALIGGGSEAALELQNSTVAASTAIYVSGDAYLYAGYTNTLKGNLNIGLPFSVNGTAVTSSAADADGFRNALYVDVQDYGSWSGANTSNGYVPGVTSDGTISVASYSALVISVAGSAGQTTTSGKTTTETPTARSEFTNDGAIHVSAGGSLDVSAAGGLGSLINNGSITLSGSAGKTTTAQIQSTVQGIGTWVIQGGSQTSAASTSAVFSHTVIGQTFNLSDATLYVDAGTGTTGGGMAFLAGTVDFTGSSGVLLISTPLNEPVTSVFADKITGFGKSDQLQLKYTQASLNGHSWNDYLTWNASTDTLDVYNMRSDLGTTLEASFRLTGSYPAGLADFALSAAWNGTESSATRVTITATSASAAKKSVLPAAAGHALQGSASATATTTEHFVSIALNHHQF